MLFAVLRRGNLTTHSNHLSQLLLVHAQEKGHEVRRDGQDACARLRWGLTAASNRSGGGSSP